MNLDAHIQNLLKEIGVGRMMNTAYDTAWIARLEELGEPIGEQALEWLRENQLPDGSWGAEQPYYAHDRVISTLAAMNALARFGRPQDRDRLRRAELAVRRHLQRLQDDPAGETIGFELIAPTLVWEARALAGAQPGGTGILHRLTPYRAAKLAALPKGMISRCVTLAFSAEMVGPSGHQLLDADNLQEPNGSVSFSPSATAYYALYVRRRDPAALKYLRQIAADGAAPNVAPFDIFEQAWTLWNLMLAAPDGDGLLPLCQPHLDFLESAWLPGRGAGFAAGYVPRDSDESSVVYDVLTYFGRSVDLDAVLHYEEGEHFRCFDLEANPSISANIHVLGALKRAGVEAAHPSVQKVLRFLQRTRINRKFWFDKWHASPYYSTAHAIIACAGYDNALVRNAVAWILSTQQEDGSWGYYLSTAEETAYCLQALVTWKQQGEAVPDHVLKQAASWLKDHMDPPYPPLWIGKCLYCPILVVRSAILSALKMASEQLALPES